MLQSFNIEDASISISFIEREHNHDVFLIVMQRVIKFNELVNMITNIHYSV